MKKHTFALTLALFMAGFAVSSEGSVVVKKTSSGYELVADGKPVYVQGAGVGLAFGKKGENYLALAKELGANVVRTWGVEQGNKKYLDEARRQGLFVFAGIWINQADPEKGISYLRGGEEYRRNKEKEVLEYVRRFKSHPAVLAWNVGNECLFFTQEENEKIALAKFLETLIQKIKQIDPDHPVLYASVSTRDLKYLNEHVPGLDIVGMNAYGGLILAQSGWEGLHFDKPYVVTEFGPLGTWDLPKDKFGKIVEESDYSKASQYRNHWSVIRDRRGKNIGGFLFHLGETTQESLTQWNINDGVFKKESFVVMQKLFGAAHEPLNHAPRIRLFSGVPRSAAPGQPFEVSVTAEDPEKGTLTYEFKASTSLQEILKYYVNKEVPIEVRGEGPKATLTAPKEPGIYRVYAFARDGAGRSASASRVMEVKAAKT